MIDIQLKDVVKTIKAVKKLGVIRMKLGTLEFELASEPSVSRPTFKVSKKKINEIEARNQLQINFDDAREELSVMHVEDPVGFEAALIQKELEDGDDIEETEI